MHFAFGEVPGAEEVAGLGEVAARELEGPGAEAEAFTFAPPA